MTSTVNSGSGTFGRQVKLPGASREVEDILLWRDVRVSAGVFVGLTALYLLLEWSGLSLLTIISNTLLGIIALAFIWNNVAKFTGKSGVPLPAVVQHGISESHLKSVAESLSVGINKGLAFTNRLISGQDVILTVKVAAGLYVFGKVGNYFSSLGLLYTLMVLAFTVPKIYELKKDDIDNAVSTAHHHGKAHYKNYVEPYVNKIPRASTSTSSASGPPIGNTTNTGAPSFGGGNQGYGGSGNQGYGGGNSGNPNLESDADSFTDVAREAVAGVSTEGKKLS